MTQSQKEFEAWANQYEYDLSWSNIIDSYAVMRTRIVWDAWQASRQALVVELSDICDLHPRKMLESEVIKRLERAGINYCQ